MDEQTMSTQELKEKREHEIYVELGKLEFDDPKRKPLLDEADKFSKILRTDSIVEQQRINSNIKNELDERKVELAIERAKIDKQRVRVEYVKAGLYTAGAFVMGFSSHFIDEWFSPDRTLGKLKDDFLKLIIRK